MNLLDLFIKVKVDDQASSEVNSLSKKIGPTMKASALIGKTAVLAAVAAVAKLAHASIKAYSQYEQLIGGVDTLFKGASETVQKNAEKAYKTAGMSANEYMETVTGFSASLIQSLAGDTERAAKYADMALIDMSDNANKMGTSIESIRFAYQGFAKQNYTMLDNLKLGYGGTKTEMQRLVNDAAKLDKSIQANDLSFSNVVKSIHAVQENMGIAGTTAAEASETIEGSLKAVGASLKNLLTGFADGKQDMGKLFDTVFQNLEIARQNIGPRIVAVMQSIIKVLPKQIPTLVKGTFELSRMTIEALIPLLPELIPNLIEAIVNLLSDAEESGAGEKMIKLGIDLIKAILIGLARSVPILLDAGKNMILNILEGAKSLFVRVKDIGVNIVKGVWEGIKGTAKWLYDKVYDFFSGIVDGVKESLGIHSPSKVFEKEIGAMMAKGIGVGFDGELSAVGTDMKRGVERLTTGSKAPVGTLSGSANSVNNISIVVNGAKYSDENALAIAIADELERMREKRGAVYG